MKVNATDGARALVKADIVEPLEARARDRFDPVIWHEKVFLPPHEQMFSLREAVQRKVRL